MLSLDSPQWSDLEHAYGAASDIPSLLKKIADFSPASGNEGPWFSLWSALAHQGDVYSASFAAVPHVILILASAPLKADATFFQFPAWVEICRVRNNVEIPDALAPAYFEALAMLPALAAAAATKPWDPDFLQAVLSAIAVAKGQTAVAEAAQELSPEVAGEFMKWFFEH